MPTFTDVAQMFAQSLVDQRFDDAWNLLTPALQAELTPGELSRRLRSMYERYEPDSCPERIWFDPEFSGIDFPARQPDDAGWAYVGIEGDGFIEAVTVVVSNVAGRMLVRSIEWGRP